MFDVPMGFEPNISLGCLTFSEYPTVHPMKLQGGALRRPINPWLTNWGTFLAPMKLQVLMMSFPSIPQMFLCFLVYIYIYILYVYVFLGFNSSTPACLKWSFPTSHPLPTCCPTEQGMRCGAIRSRWARWGPRSHGSGHPAVPVRRPRRGGASWPPNDGSAEGDTIGLGKTHGALANIAKTHGCSWPSFSSSQAMRSQSGDWELPNFETLPHDGSCWYGSMMRASQTNLSFARLKTILIYSGTPTNGLKSGNSSSKSAKPG